MLIDTGNLNQKFELTIFNSSLKIDTFQIMFPIDITHTNLYLKSSFALRNAIIT